MATLSVTPNLVIPTYHAQLGEDHVRFMDRTDEVGLPSAGGRFMSRTKGAADLFGILSKGARFASLAYPDSNLTAHVSSVTGHARTALSLAAIVGGVNKTIEAFKNKKFFEGSRNVLELGATASFASSVVVPDKVLSSGLAGIGSTIKTVVDAADLGTNVDKFIHLNNLKSKANETIGVSQEVKDGINSQLTSTGLKVGRFALAVFAGVLTVLSFVFKVALAKELLIAGLVASIASIVFSISSELVTESAKVIPVPSHMAKHFEMPVFEVVDQAGPTVHERSRSVADQPLVMQPG